MSARERLATAQAELAAALLAGGPVPPGFDAQRLRAASQALACKRAREAARALPRLAAALPDFDRRFAEHAADRPLAPGGPRADALAFARALRARGALPDAAVRELVGAELHERRAALRVARLSRGLLVALRLPLLGVRAWTLGVPARSVT